MSFARVFTINYDNLNIIGKQFTDYTSQDIEPVIITPTETVYYMIGNPFNHLSFNTFKKYTNRNKKYEIILPNFEMGRGLMNINENEEKIIKALSTTYWNNNNKLNTIKIRVKASHFVNPDLIDTNGYITFTYYNHSVIRVLQGHIMGPLLGQVLYVNDIPCSHITHFINSYMDVNLMVLTQDEPCNIGCNPTEILINDNNIMIENNGFINIIELKKTLELSNLENISIDFNKQLIEPYKNKPLLSPPINKKLFLIKWLHMDDINIPSDALQSLKSISDSYFSSVLFIDFAGKNKSIIQLFGGYVDLSESGNLEEAIKNVYNIIHGSTIYSNLNIILFYDAYTYHKHGTCVDLYSVLSNMILEFIGNNIMLIPTNLLPDGYTFNNSDRNEECMVCLD